MRVPNKIKKLSQVFIKNNFQLFLVGGALRDNLLKEKNTDYDFATDAEPQEVMNIFPHVIPVGIAHGTVLVLYENEEYEITTFRTEEKYSDNRHPDKVNFVRNIDEDLKRRDFTINAFAYDLVNHKLIDNFDGEKDLKNKIIRAIGNPAERFQEDALRMIRACRFASKLNFTIENNTLDAIKENAKLIENISAERIHDELIKIMQTRQPSIALEYLRVTGLMQYILPELLEGFEIPQNKFHKFDVYYHNLYSCDGAPADNYIVRLAALLHDIAKPRTRREKEEKEGSSFYNHEIIGSKMVYKILKRLKFSNSDIKQITHLVKHHMFYYTNDWTDGAVRRFIRNVGEENLLNLFLLRDADRYGNGKRQGVPLTFIQFKERISHILEVDSALKISDLDINGNLIMSELKLAPSPLIGEILNYLLELVLDNPDLNNAESLLASARDYYQKKKLYSQENYGKNPEELGAF